MDFQAEIVTEFSQKRLHRTRLETDHENLVVDPEEYKVDFLVLNGHVAYRSTLLLKLRERVEDKWWDAAHELAVISFRCETVSGGPHSRLYQLMVPVEYGYVSHSVVEGEQVICRMSAMTTQGWIGV